MERQTVTIGPDGVLRGLQFKGKGLDLRLFGRAAITRVSDIEWQEDEQAWAVRFLHGLRAGTLAALNDFPLFGADSDEALEAIAGACVPVGGPLLFPDYDAAVRAEVVLIQAAIRSGCPDEVLPPLTARDGLLFRGDRALPLSEAYAESDRRGMGHPDELVAALAAEQESQPISQGAPE